MHCMVDLETLDTAPTSHILSIGAVMFDRDKIVDEFYEIITIDELMMKNFTISASTLNWWIKQDEAIKEFGKGTNSIQDVLKNFSAWFTLYRGKELWGNGATFDNVILGNAYKVLGLKQPWSYKYDRCYRTIAGLYHKIDKTFEGMRHNALADARFQAEYLIELNKLYVLNIL